MDQSMRLATLWIALGDIKDQLDNKVIPLGWHLGLEDPKLMSAMEELSANIAAHFERFKLVAEVRRMR